MANSSDVLLESSEIPPNSIAPEKRVSLQLVNVEIENDITGTSKLLQTSVDTTQKTSLSPQIQYQHEVESAHNRIKSVSLEPISLRQSGSGNHQDYVPNPPASAKSYNSKYHNNDFDSPNILSSPEMDQVFKVGKTFLKFLMGPLDQIPIFRGID